MTHEEEEDDENQARMSERFVNLMDQIRNDVFTPKSEQIDMFFPQSSKNNEFNNTSASIKQILQETIMTIEEDDEI